MALLSHNRATSDWLAHRAWGDAGNLNVTHKNNASLNIQGFGACMIGGFPDVTNDFFRVACNLVSAELSFSIEASVKSLHGFTAPRAEKHLKKLICLRPDYIVFQFGSSDASCSIGLNGAALKRRVSAGRGLKRSSSPSHKLHSPATLTLIRWKVSSFLGFFLNPTPVTDLESFVSACKCMIGECISFEITPVVLSPFIFGTRHSMKNSIRYAQALEGLCRKADGAIFVDCIEPLSRFPKSEILLSDAMHICELGHQLVGQAVAKAILDDIVARRYSARTRTNAQTL